jgi:glucose/arabinose dehydrogenase
MTLLMLLTLHSFFPLVQRARAVSGLGMTPPTATECPRHRLLHEARIECPAVIRTRLLALAITLIAASIPAAVLPGFAIEKKATVKGFLTSIAFDRAGNIFVSSTEGSIYRIDEGKAVKVATAPTASEGDADLLGIVFDRDGTLVAHYVTTDLTADVMARVDLVTGDQTELAHLTCYGGRPCSSEHHGGNPIIAPDGSIYVGIGDLGGALAAQNPASPAGKIFRISSEGKVEQFALGFRNPYDMAWHAAGGFLVVGDNGPTGADEINFVRQGDNCGWPTSVGTQTPAPGTIAPAYVFQPSSEAVAPTGLTEISPVGAIPGGGFMVATFVDQAIRFFPSVDARPFRDPIVILSRDAGPVIDVAQKPNGEIYFVTPDSVWQLLVPIRGDADGDRELGAGDFTALARQVVTSPGAAALSGTWGADVNGDGVVDSRDLVALARMLRARQRIASGQ